MLVAVDYATAPCRQARESKTTGPARNHRCGTWIASSPSLACPLLLQCSQGSLQCTGWPCAQAVPPCVRAYANAELQQKCQSSSSDLDAAQRVVQRFCSKLKNESKTLEESGLSTEHVAASDDILIQERKC